MLPSARKPVQINNTQKQLHTHPIITCLLTHTRAQPFCELIKQTRPASQPIAVIATVDASHKEHGTGKTTIFIAMPTQARARVCVHIFGAYSRSHSPRRTRVDRARTISRKLPTLRGGCSYTNTHTRTHSRRLACRPAVQHRDTLR